MDTPELEALYSELQAVLRNAGLVWVVDEVAEQVRLGVPEKKEVPVYVEQTSYEVRYAEGAPLRTVKKGRKTKFESVREVSPRERVEWLLDAAEEAVVRVAQIEREILGADGSMLGHGVRSAVFVTESGGTAYQSDPRQALDRDRAATVVKRFLDEIRSEL